MKVKFWVDGRVLTAWYLTRDDGQRGVDVVGG